MYEMFRSEVLRLLGDFSRENLARVAEAMDITASGYTIGKAETALCVPGRQEFIDIATAYIITRKTEGLTDKSIEQMARVLKTFINSTLKPIKDIQPNDIRAYLFNYQRDRGISNRSLDFLRTIICTFFKWCST